MFNKIVCGLFGHKYHVLIKLNPGARKVGCVRCRKCWGMHDPTKSLIEWDSDLENMYKSFGELK